MNKVESVKTVEPYHHKPTPANGGKNGMATASLVLGIIGLLCFGLFSPLALIFGCIAIRSGYNGQAVAGLVMGTIGVISLIAFVVLLVGALTGLEAT